jgi:uncharacterized membrane protein HdeD (DUF308 family)
MTTFDQGPTDLDDSALAEIGRHWGVVLFLGLTSLVVGIVAIAWPGITIFVIAFLLATWLVVSGIFQIVRGFGSGLSGGMRALLFIGGLLSLVLGLIMFRGAYSSIEILAIFVGIAFLFRGFGMLFGGIEQKSGRGWSIFGGILMLIGGLIILEYPITSLVMLAWITGVWLIIGGVFEIVTAFMLRSAAKKA